MKNGYASKAVSIRTMRQVTTLTTDIIEGGRQTDDWKTQPKKIITVYRKVLGPE